jgi:hypothetical protein
MYSVWYTCLFPKREEKSWSKKGFVWRECILHGTLVYSRRGRKRVGARKDFCGVNVFCMLHLSIPEEGRKRVGARKDFCGVSEFFVVSPSIHACLCLHFFFSSNVCYMYCTNKQINIAAFRLSEFYAEGDIAQNTYRGRVEIGGMYLLSQLEDTPST